MTAMHERGELLISANTAQALSLLDDAKRSRA